MLNVITSANVSALASTMACRNVPVLPPGIGLIPPLSPVFVTVKVVGTIRSSSTTRIGRNETGSQQDRVEEVLRLRRRRKKGSMGRFQAIRRMNGRRNQTRCGRAGAGNENDTLSI